jgi:hypothetical protein
MHEDAYAPGAMTYAYVKAKRSSEAERFAVFKGIKKENIVKIVDLKPGELYVLHVVGFFGVISDWFSEKGTAPYPYGACMLYTTDGEYR